MANGLEHKLLRTYINLLQTNMIAYTLCKPLLRPWLISSYFTGFSFLHWRRPCTSMCVLT